MKTALIARARRAEGDDGSLALLLMISLVGLMVGALLVPIVMSSFRTTRFDVRRGHSLDAAQTGIDVVVARIRAAKDSTGTGDASLLPCGPQGPGEAVRPYTGTVNATGDAAYSVTVQYFAADPVQYPDRSTNAPIVCVSGYGTYDTRNGTRTPSFALITSTGTDGDAGVGAGHGRTLQTTYKFKVGNDNIPGGVFRIYPSSTATLAYCMDVGASPLANTAVALRECSSSNPPIAAQVFAYRDDLTIQLVSSVTTATPNGLCVASATASAGANIVLQACNVKGSPSATQVWSSDDNAHLRASNSTRTDTSSLCINVAAQAAGQALTLQSCAGGVTDPAQTWVGSPSAGAGEAGVVNHQLTNYQQFGRCLDVTNFSTGTDNGGGEPGGGLFLILYSCKQNPGDWTKVGSNQRWTASPAVAATPTTGTWTTDLDGMYCLTSPKAVGGYVIVKKCTSASGANTTWTTYSTKDAAGATLPYSMQYTVVDSSGLCLDLGPNSDVYHGAYYKATVAKCNGSSGQKWNALGTVSASQLQNTRELP